MTGIRLRCRVTGIARMTGMTRMTGITRMRSDRNNWDDKGD